MGDLLFHEGQLIANKYRVERVLGRGGMGVVFAAHHVALDKRVAIKVLLPELALHAEAAIRFTRESRAAAKIRSEHVARILDVGQLEDGAPFMVMEYLEGGDLAARLVQSPIATDDALDYVLQACEALAEAHLAGIVHRDLKPANLFLSKRADGSEVVKVLDFGISKADAPAEGNLTQSATFMGSTNYASPEQLVSTRDVDARSDIWSLGVVLYEMLARRLPFQGEGVMETAAHIMQLPPPPLVQLRPDLPAALCSVVMLCLEKQKDDRFTDVGALALAIAPFAPRSDTSVQRISRVLGEGQLPRAGPSAPPGLPSAPPAPPPAAPVDAIAATVPVLPAPALVAGSPVAASARPAQTSTRYVVYGALGVAAVMLVLLVVARAKPSSGGAATAGLVASATEPPASTGSALASAAPLGTTTTTIIFTTPTADSAAAPAPAPSAPESRPAPRDPTPAPAACAVLPKKNPLRVNAK